MIGFREELEAKEMAKDAVSYDKIQAIAQMSVEEYKEDIGTGATLFNKGKSDEDIQNIIDRYKIGRAHV